MIEPCNCFKAGFCDRHLRDKDIKEVRLCRSDWQYREYYDKIVYGLKHQERLISTADLVKDTQSIIPRIDQNSIIVGIPRSGMLPASILATSMHLPLYSMSRKTLDFTDVGSGRRIVDPEEIGLGSKKIYLVDDSSCSGLAMKECYDHLKTVVDNEIVRVAIYSNSITRASLDIYAKSYELHFFEWNLFNCLPIMYDIDGVLCRDFSEEECKNEELYLKTLQSMQRTQNNPVKYPLSLVTGRLEKYRPQTEKWLTDSGFRIKDLIMWPENHSGTHEEVGLWKAEHFAKSGYSTFCESSEVQAKTIFKATGKTVLCMDNMTVYHPSPLS